MNIRKEGDFYIVQCHKCKQDLDLGYLYQDEGNGIYCIFCNTLLGYIHDLPIEFLNKYAKNGKLWR